jgi:hypothetical protein
MTLHPKNLLIELPENSAALDADVCSARMQALPASSYFATARARMTTGVSMNSDEKKRGVVSSSRTSTALLLILVPEIGGELSSAVPAAS